jgi:hypothetical protein
MNVAIGGPLHGLAFVTHSGEVFTHDEYSRSRARLVRCLGLGALGRLIFICRKEMLPALNPNS